MATHCYDKEKGHMVPMKPSEVSSRTSFLILRDGKVIFDGSGRELAGTSDEYIKEYIA